MAIVLAAPVPKTILDDFESYTPGAFFPNAIWNEENSNATWDVIATGAFAPLPTQHLSATMNVEGGAYITHIATGSVADGSVFTDVFGTGGVSSNNQAGLMLRYIDSSNFITVRLGNFVDPDALTIDERINNITTSVAGPGVTWSTTVPYYVEAIMSGTNITANVYTDAERTNLFTTVTKTGVGLASGKIGLSAIGSAVYRFDNFDYIP